MDFLKSLFSRLSAKALAVVDNIALSLASVLSGESLENDNSSSTHKSKPQS